MQTKARIGDFEADVILKDIKNVHLSVHPPTGRVRIAAPVRMSMDAIRVFAISKLDWIRKHQRGLQGQERESPREFLDRESHYVWGRRYLLKIVEVEQTPHVELQHRRLRLQIRPGTDVIQRRAILELWYREQIRAAIPELLAKWQPIIGVKVQRVYVRRMKTIWGSCHAATGSIRLNTDLAKKPRECLEYTLVHEMVHLLVPTHNSRFIALMDRHLPEWRHLRDRLNRLPVRHEHWTNHS